MHTVYSMEKNGFEASGGRGEGGSGNADWVGGGGGWCREISENFPRNFREIS